MWKKAVDPHGALDFIPLIVSDQWFCDADTVNDPVMTVQDGEVGGRIAPGRAEPLPNDRRDQSPSALPECLFAHSRGHDQLGAPRQHIDDHGAQHAGSSEHDHPTHWEGPLRDCSIGVNDISRSPPQRSSTVQISHCRAGNRISSTLLSSSVTVEKKINVASSVSDMNPFA